MMDALLVGMLTPPDWLFLLHVAVEPAFGFIVPAGGRPRGISSYQLLPCKGRPVTDDWNVGGT